MFDDPNGYLRRLDEELRAEDSDSDQDLDFEAFLREDEPASQEDDWLLEAKALLGDAEPQPAPARRSQPRPMEEARHARDARQDASRQGRNDYPRQAERPRQASARQAASARQTASVRQEQARQNQRPTAAQAYSAQDERERMERRSVPQEKKQKGVGGLVLLALLELAGILAVVLWWVRWLV